MARMLIYGSLLVHSATAVLHGIPDAYALVAGSVWSIASVVSLIPVVTGIVRLLVPSLDSRPPEILGIEN